MAEFLSIQCARRISHTTGLLSKRRGEGKSRTLRREREKSDGRLFEYPTLGFVLRGRTSHFENGSIQVAEEMRSN